MLPLALSKTVPFLAVVPQDTVWVKLPTISCNEKTISTVFSRVGTVKVKRLTIRYESMLQFCCVLSTLDDDGISIVAGRSPLKTRW